MTKWTDKLLEFAITRSFKVKSAILFLGAAMILYGSELRRTDPYLGLAIYFTGLLLDWGIIYLVYVEITQVQDETEDISERAFGRHSSTRPPFETLESKVEDLESEVGIDFTDPSSLNYRVDELEEEVDNIKDVVGIRF